MKRFTCLLLALAMILVFPGCSSQSTTSSAGTTPASTATAPPSSDSAGQPAADQRFKVGFINYSFTDTLSLAEKALLEHMGELFNCEFVFVASDMNDEAAIANVENLCSQGCDAIMTHIGLGSIERIMSICESYGVYFATTNGLITDEAAYEKVKNNPYFVGGTSEDEYAASYTLVSTLVEKYGAKDICLVGRVAGATNSQDQRWAGFMQAVQDHPGVNVLSESRGKNKPENAEAAQNLIALYPNMDAIVFTGAGMDAGSPYVEAAGKVGEIMVGTIDIGAEADKAFEKGSVSVAMGGQYPDPAFSFLLLYNALTGNKLSDEPIFGVMNYITIASLEDYNRYYALAVEQMPYTDEELLALSKKHNPDLTAEAFLDVVERYSLDDIVARMS